MFGLRRAPDPLELRVARLEELFTALSTDRVRIEDVASAVRGLETEWLDTRDRLMKAANRANAARARESRHQSQEQPDAAENGVQAPLPGFAGKLQRIKGG